MPSSGVQTCALDRKSTRLNSSHGSISYAVFCLENKTRRLTYRHRGIPLGVVSLTPHRRDVRVLRVVSADPPPLHVVNVALVGPLFFFFNDPAPAELSPFPLHGPLPL